MLDYNTKIGIPLFQMRKDVVEYNPPPPRGSYRSHNLLTMKPN